MRILLLFEIQGILSQFSVSTSSSTIGSSTQPFSSTGYSSTVVYSPTTTSYAVSSTPTASTDSTTEISTESYSSTYSSTSSIPYSLGSADSRGDFSLSSVLTQSSTVSSTLSSSTQYSSTTTEFDENCITYTHFGDVLFEAYGGSFPETKIEKIRPDDSIRDSEGNLIVIEDLHHCKKECASIAGCFQIHYSDEGCFLFNGVDQVDGETFSTKLENCGEFEDIND
ncbi:Oidioi.mRNA.OKI2018_I69.chr1.g495.t1.cds [Oikopleura dioica]|uniref:Oidioi.mRNA.OKI2018_I69.chr1.g495.t1.cds n=1 Tax=Oikopleura dioica TaxID=34765 RepID=A0ABN7SK07_OIKDI|nr:Oidioi.mRNA.OKI2018_I69.chr1.g495.t1.cds [Oikopleura dioica]